MSNKPLFMVFVLMCLIISISTTSAAEATKIAIGGSDPAIYENKVVWVDDTGNQIHLYDLSTKQDTPIVSSQASNLDIYGNTLAWLDKSGDAPKLVIYDIGTAETYSLAEGSADDYSRPAIYGDRVVWSAKGVVYEFNMPNKIQTTIVTGRDPDIYGNKIAYATEGDEGPIIKVYDTSTEETITVPYRGVAGNPHIYGDKVTLHDSHTRAGNMIMYDLVTGIVTVVTSDSTEIDGLESGCDTGDNEIYGDKIVYAKLTDDGLGNAGIYVYNIPDAKSEMIFRTGDNTGAMLDIYGNTIVWEYAGDIYTFNMVENSLNAPSPQITSVTIDPLTGVPEDGTATIKVTVKNNGGKSSAGYISVSFPNNEEITSTEGTNSNAKIYPVGSEIWGKDGIIDSSKNRILFKLNGNL